MSHTPTRTQSALTLLLFMPAMVWTLDLLAGTPPVIIAASALPALVFAATILFAQRGAGRPRALLALSLAWGALGAAFLATIGNDLARRWIEVLAGDDARTVTAVLVAPVLEETAKALGLVLLLVFRRGSLRNAQDGIVYGALIGVGFVCTENLLYLGLSMLQGGEAGLVRALYLRGALGGATHVVFTACAGAGLGWPAAWNRREEIRTRLLRLAPVLGFLTALTQHYAWNALAAPLISRALCGAEIIGGPCRDVPTGAALFGGAGLVALVFLAPGLLLLRVVWKSQPRADHERRLHD